MIHATKNVHYETCRDFCFDTTLLGVVFKSLATIFHPKKKKKYKKNLRRSFPPFYYFLTKKKKSLNEGKIRSVQKKKTLEVIACTVPLTKQQKKLNPCIKTLKNTN